MAPNDIERIHRAARRRAGVAPAASALAILSVAVALVVTGCSRDRPARHAAPEGADSLDQASRAASLMSLGASHLAEGRYAEADSCYRGALAIRERAPDSRTSDVARSHNDLATALFFEGRLDSAEVHCREAVRLWGAVLPPDHPSLLTGRSNLAIVLRSLGQYSEAEATFRDVLARRLARLGPDDPDVGHAALHLGILLTMPGRARLAEPYLVDAVRVRERAFGPDDPRSAQARDALERCHLAMGAPIGR